MKNKKSKVNLVYKVKRLIKACWLHKHCQEKGIITRIPKRNYGKDTHYRKTARKRAAKNFNKKTYGRREIVETVFSNIKRKFRPSVSSTT